GGDSILSAQLVSRAARHGMHLRVSSIFQHPEIGQLARVATWRSGVSTGASQIQTGPVPLTWAQQWFFAQGFAHPERYNQSVLLTVPSTTSPATLAKGLRSVMSAH